MVIDQFFPFIGGAEKQSLLLSKKLIDNSIIVNVLTTKQRGLKKREIYKGINIYRISIYGWSILRQIYIIGAITIKIIYLKNKSDIIHVHGAKHVAFAATLASKIINKPVIVKVTNSGIRFDINMLDKFLFGFGKILSKFLINNVNLFISLTPNITNELKSKGVKTNKIINIPNGIEKPLEIKKIFNIQKTGVCVASLTKKKNHETLFKSFAEVIKVSKTKLIIVGDGPLKIKLTEMINELKLNNYVTITGYKQDVQRYYSIADYFILLSWTEGLSNSVLEAMSYGLPSIVSDIPSNRFIINENNGILVNPKKINKISKSIIKIVEDNKYRKKLGANAKKASDDFSIDKIVSKYISVYRKLIV